MTNVSFWDKAAAKYAKSQISDMAAYTKTRDRMCEILQPHHRVLEIGCGTGSTALELADRVDRYIGTDVSQKMISIAQAKLTEDAPDPLSFAVHGVADLPPGPHDVVIALNVLHLLPDLEGALAKIFETVPSGGVLIAKTALLKEGAWFLPWIVPLMQAIGKAPYVRSLSEVELSDMMRNAGFLVTETLVQPGLAPRIFTVASKP